MPLTRGGVMKFIIDLDFPQEPFSTFLRHGTAGEKIGEVLGAIKPEAIYFTDNGAGRGAMMIVDLDSASQAPHVTEPLMLTFDASVHYRVAMSLEELQSAGLDRYVAA
jgi:hypothetical protein